MSSLLGEREKTHGDYRDVADLSQALKEVFKSGNNWEALSNTQRESLEMISSKIARILSGDSNFRDHWDDIEGYAKLGGNFSPNNLPTVTLDIARASQS